MTGIRVNTSGTAAASLPWFDVTDYGAVGDGATDDTAAIQAAIDAAASAGGGVVFFPASVYIVGGALQDTGNANAQIVLPALDYVDTEQVTIEFRGESPSPPIVSVIGATPLPDGHSVIKSTLAAGTGALMGGRVASGSLSNFTNVMFRASNLTFRTVANPTITALDLATVAAVDLDNVSVDAGSYNVSGLAEPTTASSYGIRLPNNDNGAYVRLGAVGVVGFYNGYRFAEHTVGQQVTAMGCKRAAVFIETNHASKINRLLVQHCERVVVFEGTHYVDIDQLNIEHATTGWQVTDYDIDDASDYGLGSIVWHVVLAGTGPDDTFTTNGGANLHIRRITEPAGVSLIDDDTFATASATTAASSESIKVYVDTQVAAAGSDRIWMPLTTVVGGVPELVWDDDNSLIPTEVPT